MKFAVALTFLVMFLVLLTPQHSPQKEIHLAMGRHFLQEGFRSAGSYSFSKTEPMKNSPWLAQILIWKVYQLGGDAALWLLKALMGTVGLFLVYCQCRKKKASIPLSLIFTFWTCCLILYSFNLQPDTFTFAFFAAFLYFSEQKPLSWSSLKLFPLVLLWANTFPTHILVSLFLAAVGLYKLFLFLFPDFPLKGEDTGKGFLLPLALSLIFLSAAFATPFFSTSHLPVILQTPFKTVFQPGHGEWKLLSRWHPQEILYLLYVLAALLSLVLSFPHQKGKDILLLLYFVSLPFFSRRNIAAAVTVTAPLCASFATFAFKMRGQRLARYFPPGSSFFGLATFALFLLAYTYLWPFRYVFSVPLSPSAFEESSQPHQAVTFIKLNEFPKRIFNDPLFGGYLILELYPRHQISLDQRYTTAYHSDYVFQALRTLQGKEGWQGFLEKYKITCVLLKPLRPLVKALDRDPEWQWIYQDEKSVIFVKRSEKALIQNFENNSLTYPDEVSFQKSYAKALLRRNLLDKAEVFLQKALNHEKSPEVFTDLALIQMEKGDFSKAASYLEEALEHNPEYLPALVNLSYSFLQIGKKDKARSTYEKARALSPDDRAVRSLGTILKQSQK